LYSLSSQLLCRLDNVTALAAEVQQGLAEMRRFTNSRAAAEEGAEGMHYLATMVHELARQERVLMQCVQPVELVGSAGSEAHFVQGTAAADSNSSSLNGNKISSSTGYSVALTEKVASEGSAFVTSNFLFEHSCGPEGIPLGVLALEGGCGAAHWAKTPWVLVRRVGRRGIRFRRHTCCVYKVSSRFPFGRLACPTWSSL
jgi:hypothetical protein